jgi:hypothetical protein
MAMEAHAQQRSPALTPGTADFRSIKDDGDQERNGTADGEPCSSAGVDSGILN